MRSVFARCLHFLSSLKAAAPCCNRRGGKIFNCASTNCKINVIQKLFACQRWHARIKIITHACTLPLMFHRCTPTVVMCTRAQLIMYIHASWHLREGNSLACAYSSVHRGEQFRQRKSKASEFYPTKIILVYIS